MLKGRGARTWAFVLVGLVFTAGIASFVLAYNSYPRKNVNILYDGACYELVEEAYESYRMLNARLQMEALRLRLNAIENPQAMLKIALSGSSQEVTEFVERRDVKITDARNFGGIDKILVEGFIMKSVLDDVVNSNYHAGEKSDAILSNLALLPSDYITEAESDQIAAHLAIITDQGIEEIMLKKSGIRKSDCR